VCREQSKLTVCESIFRNSTIAITSTTSAAARVCDLTVNAHAAFNHRHQTTARWKQERDVLDCQVDRFGVSEKRDDS